MVKLDKPVRREVDIGGTAHTLVIDPQGLKPTRKGARRGLELTWDELTSGDAALAAALAASLHAAVG